MTNRDFFTAIVNLENIAEEFKEHAKKEIEKLDKRNASRSSKQSKTQKENEPIKAEILEYLNTNGGYHTASEIAEFNEISVQKASALCRQLVEGGQLEVKEIKVPKKGKQKAYAVLDSAKETEEVEKTEE